MQASADDVFERILSKRIDKQDALRHFSALPEDDRQRLLTRLKSALPAAEDPAPASTPEPAGLLTPVHEADLTDEHRQFIETLVRQFAARHARSRENAARHQAYFVDQRKVAGLKRALKPMQFQLTYERAEGAWLYDVDGNRYVDITGDQGVNFFGHQPEFIKQALRERLEQGYPLVGYSEDLFEAARLFCELTGHERMVFTQSGTEAVMWAVRIARAATGRGKVVIFDGAYHGLSDTVMAVRGRNGASLAAGLGMLQSFADELIILDYGDMAQLDALEAQVKDIACVLVEPVQSRFPSRQPHAFVRELRRLTLEHDIVLIFDEMITGMRAGRQGAEAFYQVKPDLATYGKVPGGGMPTGIIAGLARYMDYVDGGVWGLDDPGMPSLKRAVIAGTHTQNSLKVSTTLAVLREMQRLCQAEHCEHLGCDCPIGALNRRTRAMCEAINAHCRERRVPLTLDYFSSLFRVSLADDPYGLVRELFMILLKTHGVETSLSGNHFLTLAHGDDEAGQVVEGFRRSVDTLLEQGFFREPAAPATADALAVPAPAPASAPASAGVAGAARLDQLRALLLADLRELDTMVN